MSGVSVVEQLDLRPRRELFDEFMRNPGGPHCPELARLLKVMRSRTTMPWVAAIECPAGYRLVGLSGRGRPLEFLSDESFASLHEAETAAFAIRWRQLFGQVPPDAGSCQGTMHQA
ncbi:hypothetical protein EN745_06705 [Mesorhizobium sp. M4A.F.Ca.ET.022.05.2.1]|uniref:hypothetical protein n=1 Tax=Mesorhizobium sp. M4A.F.Ca.ET.022.05.2.1 TaxID=2496653 RepID=UPI000FCAE503|nr:hypothetical protein [Mesorhizobium sp. M4A.F.Ca.ET.022.05.2.1]RVC82496.1 hypothetical protein EN745_06705 [Mesorhizobium sp. M4A.F.Ca.ET.022.05.2.1]